MVNTHAHLPLVSSLRVQLKLKHIKACTPIPIAIGIVVAILIRIRIRIHWVMLKNQLERIIQNDINLSLYSSKWHVIYVYAYIHTYIDINIQIHVQASVKVFVVGEGKRGQQNCQTCCQPTGKQATTLHAIITGHITTKSDRICNMRKRKRDSTSNKSS